MQRFANTCRYYDRTVEKTLFAFRAHRSLDASVQPAQNAKEASTPGGARGALYRRSSPGF